MNKRAFVGFLVLVAVAAVGFAQQLPVTTSTVKLDGLIAGNEYSLATPLGKMTVYATRTADMLYLGISAPTTGWVALGFGSDKMDGALLFLGTVANGKAALSQQRGSGHTHKAMADTLTVDYAVSEDKGATTLEMAFKAADVVAAGQSELTILAAYGATDTITAYHTARDRVTLKLQ
jgi:hypothetical protein